MGLDRRKTAIAGFTVENSKLDDRISENFYLRELVKSDLAIRRGINNWFRMDSQVQSAVYLCRSVLQPLREQFGAFTPNSVYRSQALERALKNKPPEWRSKSQHTLGQAADLEIPGISNYDLAIWVDKNMPYDQIILEMYHSGDPSSGWVHVSTLPSGINRLQVLTFDGTTYQKGLLA